MWFRETCGLLTNIQHVMELCMTPTKKQFKISITEGATKSTMKFYEITQCCTRNTRF